MIRATTGGVMKTYRSNLMNSFITMNKGMNTILSQRTFNSFAEDPAAAAKAFRLRKSRMTVESQYDICTDALGKYRQAVSCLQSNDDILCTKDGVYGQYMTTLTGTTLSMLNDTTGDAREQLAKALDQMSQTIIQTMNQKYGDNFIFAGADGHNVPFEIVNNRLYYRGVPVDAALPNVLTDRDDNPIAVSKDGVVINDPDAAKQVYYLDMDRTKKISKEEYEKLRSAVPNVRGNPPTAHSTDIGNMDLVNDPKYAGLGFRAGVTYYILEEPYLEDTPYIADANGTRYITKDDYDAIKGLADDSRYLRYEGSGGSASFVTMDKYGNIVEDGSGDYYVIFDQDHLMDKEDYDEDKRVCDKLQYLASETCFVDIGFGFQEDPVTGKLIETSAFDISLNGISFLGYGVDEDGDPRNIYSLVQRMREVSDSVPEAGKWNDATWDEFNRLVGKFEKAVSSYQTEFVNLDASTTKLKSQQDLLEDNFDNLQEQYSDIEDVDMVDAITSFLWAQYCYNAALKVGNNVLSQSLMDYLS